MAIISVLPTYPFCILLYSKSNTCFQEELEAACGTGSRTADAARLSVRSVRREDFASGDLSPSTLLVSFLSPAQEACKGLNIFAPLPTKEFFGLLAAVCVLEHLPTDFWTENIRQATEVLVAMGILQMLAPTTRLARQIAAPLIEHGIIPLCH